MERYLELSTQWKNHKRSSSNYLVQANGSFFKSIGTRRRTHQAIMHTVKKAREEEDMDFREALDYAKVSYPKKNPNRRWTW